MAYFRKGIMDDWAHHIEHERATGSDPVQPLERKKGAKVPSLARAADDFMAGGSDAL
jgi:hypothetical protein